MLPSALPVTSSARLLPLLSPALPPLLLLLLLPLIQCRGSDRSLVRAEGHDHLRCLYAQSAAVTLPNVHMQ